MDSEVIRRLDQDEVFAGGRHEYQSIILDAAGDISVARQLAASPGLVSRLAAYGTSDVGEFACRLARLAGSSEPSRGELAWAALNLKMLFRARRDQRWTALEVWERYCRENPAANATPLSIDAQVKTSDCWPSRVLAEPPMETRAAPLSRALLDAWQGEVDNLEQVAPGFGAALEALQPDVVTALPRAPENLLSSLCLLLGRSPERVCSSDVPKKLRASVQINRFGQADAPIHRHLGIWVDASRSTKQVLLYAAVVAKGRHESSGWAENLGQVFPEGLGEGSVHTMLTGDDDVLSRAISSAWTGTRCGLCRVVVGREIQGQQHEAEVAILVGVRGQK